MHMCMFHIYTYMYIYMYTYTSLSLSLSFSLILYSLLYPFLVQEPGVSVASGLLRSGVRAGQGRPVGPQVAGLGCLGLRICF